MLEKLNPRMIQDLEEAQEAIVLLLNVVEELKQEIVAQKEEIQKQRDEINRLKGEQGKPKIKASKKPGENYSSEKERQQNKKPGKGEKRRKHAAVKVDRIEIIEMEQEALPADAVFKGYEEVLVQDVRLETDNILFKRAKYYSAEEQQSYIAPLPAGYEGQFGPTIRALVVSMYYQQGMSEPKIIEFMEEIGVNISKGKVSELLTQGAEAWAGEADEIIKAGLASSSWQHIDDTGTRVNGVNHYCHVLCNPYYTAYATRPRKDRLTVIAVLQNSEEVVCCFNEKTSAWLETFNVPKWAQRQIAEWPQEQLLTAEEVTTLLSDGMMARLSDQQQARIREAGALTAYYEQTTYPVIPILVSDDARQFQHLSDQHMLCWVHEGRHYKKLTPQVAYHQQILDDFLTEFWNYYHRLQAYRADPLPETATVLRADFKTLFSQTTDYDQLKARLVQTLAHQDKLLVVLDHPEVPLHNNPAELGARQRVRKRDISFGPRTTQGRIAWDVFMTVAETAKKLGVSFFKYVLDRVSQSNQMPALADIIRSRGHPDSSLAPE